MFLINSRFPLVSAAPIPSHQHVVLKVGAPLLPKLRGHFAEFLNHDSLDRLSILYLTTCVGLGYGQFEPHADAFLGSIGSPDHPPCGRPSGLRHTAGGFTYRQPYTLRPGHFHCPARLPSCVTPVNALASPVQVPRSPSPSPSKTGFGMVRAVSITGSAWAVLHWYGNINPLSIDYACRPRLRSRLTQGRLA